MKNNAIAFIRLISLIMIVSCHILQGLGNKMAFWVNVGVQIFLFISGFLYGTKKIDNFSNFYKQRLIKILLPFSIFSIIICLIEVLVLKNDYSFKFIIGNLFGLGGLIGTYSLVSHTWFISYIMICYLITPLLQKIFNGNFRSNLIKLILLCICLQGLESYAIVRFNACWVINFILGYFYSLSYNDKKERIIYTILIFTTFVFIFPFAVIYQETLNISLPNFFNHFQNYFINYGHVLLGCVIFIILYYAFNLFKVKNNKIFDFSDKYPYYIYLVHQVFILNYFSILHYTKYLSVNIILITILSIVSGVILQKISNLLIRRLIKLN